MTSDTGENGSTANTISSPEMSLRGEWEGSASSHVEMVGYCSSSRSGIGDINPDQFPQIRNAVMRPGGGRSGPLRVAMACRLSADRAAQKTTSDPLQYPEMVLVSTQELA